jgi:hypothetical protein
MNAPLRKPAPAGNHNAPLKTAPQGAPGGGGAGALPPGRNLAPGAGGGSDLDSGKADLDDLGLPEPEMDAEPSAPAPARGGSSGGGDATTNASTNFPPVGDIKLNKSKGTFNTYKLELSYGQIECIRQALEKDHANPIADELLQMFNYYISTVPGPGEEEDDVKARAESSAIGQKLGQEEEDDGMGLPMPPGQEQEQGTTVAGEGPEGGAGDDLEADPRFQDAPDAEAGGGGGGGAPPGFKEETDQRLPAPPRE